MSTLSTGHSPAPPPARGSSPRLRRREDADRLRPHVQRGGWGRRRVGCLARRQIDQITQVVEQLRTNPDSRRIIVSAWNVGELDQMKLMPCHAFFQFYVSDKRLSCQLYQRSADIFLGVPFNIASYALLTHMLAQQCDLEVGEFIWTGGDCHLYANHLEQVDEQLSRVPLTLPKLVLTRRPPSISDYEFEDFQIVNYQHHPAIKAPVAV